MMGMGEPLLNYDQVVRALGIIRSREGGIGGRRITVSTAGYVPGIRRLADEDLNVDLAISLNATRDETRTRLMPINRRFPIAELLEAARFYYERRGRRVTFEYVLMAGVTDSDGDAVGLASLSRQLPCKVNLIPYNELSGLPPGGGGLPAPFPAAGQAIRRSGQSQYRNRGHRPRKPRRRYRRRLRAALQAPGKTPCTPSVPVRRAGPEQVEIK